MLTQIKMPVLSPTMEEGTLAKWLVKTGDSVKSGDLLAEIETDKATMEFEAVDEGVIASIAVLEGTDNVKVGTVIATLDPDGEGAAAPQTVPRTVMIPGREDPNKKGDQSRPIEPDVAAIEDHGSPPPMQAAPPNPTPLPAPAASSLAVPAAPPASGERAEASPLARRIAMARSIDLSTLTGSGPHGRIVKADVEAVGAAPLPAAPPVASLPAIAPEAPPQPVTPQRVAIPDVPHEQTKLSNMRKTIARRLTESKQTVPHIYLTVEVRLDALLTFRGEINTALEARGVKLSVNDMLVKALALALMQEPSCNVMFTPEQLISFKRADISVAVSTPTGLLTPVVVGAEAKSLSTIATEVRELAARARDGKLKPEEYAGGTASISNMGMHGIKQFDAVINPPQAMILAVGAGEKRAWVEGDKLGVATVMSATGSFDHRAIDGADGAALMRSFKALVEAPLLLAA
ncbi:pyruvate dehydrogenase complex dihydrolipoamide acetyltransferase [uncultured Sphingomonas sp.]|uniref:pyruvate dehydrogenase complex dihydrolipoamide acetyltransferase n=1 Tax=uncultured Sphingomonas sp. TaxID=158754 RepID=UPI0035CB6C4F